MDQLTIDLQRTVEFIKAHPWTRGALAKRRVPDLRISRDRTCSPFSANAYSFCLLGAVMKANGIRLSSPRIVNIDAAVRAETGFNPEEYNDHVAKDKRYVIRMLNRIIKKHTARG